MNVKNKRTAFSLEAYAEEKKKSFFLFHLFVREQFTETGTSSYERKKGVFGRKKINNWKQRGRENKPI